MEGRFCDPGKRYRIWTLRFGGVDRGFVVPRCGSSVVIKRFVYGLQLMSLIRRAGNSVRVVGGRSR